MVKRDELDPNHPILRSAYAPHETGAILRMHRVGYPGREISRMLRISPSLLMSKIRAQLEAEKEADRRNLAIHDGRPHRRGIR